MHAQNKPPTITLRIVYYNDSSFLRSKAPDSCNLKIFSKELLVKEVHLSKIVLEHRNDPTGINIELPIGDYCVVIEGLYTVPVVYPKITLSKKRFAFLPIDLSTDTFVGAKKIIIRDYEVANKKYCEKYPTKSN
jgi:hypothetical protein